jgi:hypothetical protein
MQRRAIGGGVVIGIVAYSAARNTAQQTAGRQAALPVWSDKMAPRRGVSLENSTGCLLIVGHNCILVGSFAQHKFLRSRSLRFVQMSRISFSDPPLCLLH